MLSKVGDNEEGGLLRMAVFGLLPLQVLVLRQFARICHSVKMEWGVKEIYVAVIAFHNCGKSCSQIFTLLKPLKISRIFIYWVFKHYKELWRVEGRLKSARAKAAIKRVRERICRNALWKKRSCPESWTYWPNRCCASSGTINTWKRNTAQRDTSLCLLRRRSDGQEQSVSSSGKPRTGTITSSSQTRRSSPSRSSTTTRTRFMLKCPLRCVPRVQGGHHPSYVMVWWRVSHQVVTPLHFCQKGLKLVPECNKRTCYKELWNLLTRPSSMVINGSSSRTQLLPTRPRWLRSGYGGTFWPSSAPRIGSRRVQTSNPWSVNCELFARTWLAESVTTTLP